MPGVTEGKAKKIEMYLGNLTTSLPGAAP